MLEEVRGKHLVLQGGECREGGKESRQCMIYEKTLLCHRERSLKFKYMGSMVKQSGSSGKVFPLERQAPSL